MSPRVTLTDSPDAAAQAALESGLARDNTEQAGLADARPLAVLITDPATEQTVGGRLGRTSLGLLFVDLFFLPVHPAVLTVGRGPPRLRASARLFEASARRGTPMATTMARRNLLGSPETIRGAVLGRACPPSGSSSRSSGT